MTKPGPVARSIRQREGSLLRKLGGIVIVVVAMMPSSLCRPSDQK
jgi:hypothetical protein